MTRGDKIALFLVLAIFIPAGLCLEYRRTVLGSMALGLAGIVAWRAW